MYFYTDEKDYAIDTKFLSKNSNYGNLPTPTKTGYNFDGWYSLETGGVKITSDSTFTGVTQLYARWSKKEENPFTDVPSNTYYYNAVNYCYKNKIISGTSVTKFSPNTDISRGMFVTILWRMDGSKIVNGKTFTDVKNEEYYSNAVKWAESVKIVSGYENGKFGPNDKITREQLATMLLNYAKYKKKDISKRTELNKYADYSGISGYAKDAMSWAVAKKVIRGKNNETKLAPRGKATRAEAVVMIANYCEYVGR